MDKMVALLENSRERKTITEQISSVKAQIDTTRQFRTERSMNGVNFVTSCQSNLVTTAALSSAVRTTTTATSHHMDLGMINEKS